MRRTHFVVCLFLTCLALFPVNAKSEEPRTEFIKGIDFGARFLKPNTQKGKKYRAALVKIHHEFGPWILKYAPYEYVPFLSRAWIESRGNPWSHTKDTALMEAGLTSATYEEAWKVCDEWGVCGDPCGDAKLSIAISAYRRYRAHSEMLYGTNPNTGEPTFWSSWLPMQAEENYYEARAFMGICGSANCSKVRKAVKLANKKENVLSRVGKDGKHHVWWYTISWLRDQNQSVIESLFQPLPSSMTEWRFGTKWGRTMAGLDMRTEFYESIETNEEGKPIPNHCFSPNGDPYFPHRTEIIDGVKVEVPDFPEPIVKWTKKTFPKKEHWRNACTFYGDKKAWRKTWGGPNRNDKWKTAGMKYHPVDGHPISVKKGEKKFKSKDEWLAAYNKWFNDQQEEGRLPSDEEYQSSESKLADIGCPFHSPIEE